MKREQIKSVRALCLASVAALYLGSGIARAQASPSEVPSANEPKGHMQKSVGGSDDMKQSMMKGMDGMEKMQMSGDTDKDFATMMKMHHQKAVEMAQMELAQGKSPEMKALATQIIAAQKKEIGEFEKWLAKHK